MTIKIGILGYGNLGRGVEINMKNTPDMELVGIFTRRNPESLTTMHDTPVYSASTLPNWVGKIDVLIICGGSATDLPRMTPEYAKLFNVVDSFDTHAKIPEHFANVDAAATAGGKIAVISTGWDPGMFSLNRLYAGAILPNGADYTFWGPGVSQGHSDALRRIPGIADAKQYTIPVNSALEQIRGGATPKLSAREKHTRECYVVLEDGADAAQIEQTIKSMPNYFAEYDTTVHFITQDELDKNHSRIPHGGFVLRVGETSDGIKHLIEYDLKLVSNPEFTAGVLIAFARAAYRLNADGCTGCKTVFDIPPAYLSPKSVDELRAALL